MTNLFREVVTVAALAGFLGAVVLMGSQVQPQAPVEDGQTLYGNYCASCHGVTGEGNGPAAGALRQRPANLTTFAVDNGGIFPAMKLQRIIDGRDVTAHGSREMPVWGNVFKNPGKGATDQSVKARIQAIVEYLELIQMRRG